MSGAWIMYRVKLSVVISLTILSALKGIAARPGFLASAPLAFAPVSYPLHVVYPPTFALQPAGSQWENSIVNQFGAIPAFKPVPVEPASSYSGAHSSVSGGYSSKPSGGYSDSKNPQIVDLTPPGDSKPSGGYEDSAPRTLQTTESVLATLHQTLKPVDSSPKAAEPPKPFLHRARDAIVGHFGPKIQRAVAHFKPKITKVVGAVRQGVTHVSTGIAKASARVGPVLKKARESASKLLHPSPAPATKTAW